MQAILLNCSFLRFKVAGSTQKPEDMYRIIEHFALGRRRLELFGEDHNIRAGWLTVGKGLSSSNFESQVKTTLYFHSADIYLFLTRSVKICLTGFGDNACFYLVFCEELCGQGW